MAATIKLGNKEWAAKKDSLLAYNDEDNNFKPLPFDFTRASSATFVGDDGLIKTSTTAQPRIDFTDNASGHLLLEPVSTNLLAYSEDFSSWLKSGVVTITPNYTTSPSGQNNATRLQWTNATNFIYQQISHAGSHFTISIYLKSNTNVSQNVRLFMDNGAQTQNVLVTTQWQRFEFTNFTTPTQSIRNTGLIKSSSQVEDLDISIWGAQFEAGSFSTSYIPTISGTVTRAAETCLGSGNSQVINSTEGVLFADIAALADNQTYRTISLSDGSNNEAVRIRFKNTSNTINGLIRDGGSAKANINYQVSDIKQFHKVAFKYKSGNSQLWVDGVQRGSSTDTFTLSTQTVLKFNQGHASDFFYGKCKQLKVYDKALTDSELKTLTT